MNKPDIRDAIAIVALHALITSPQRFTVYGEASAELSTWNDWAKAAYKMADAMLGQRNEKPEAKP